MFKLRLYVKRNHRPRARIIIRIQMGISNHCLKARTWEMSQLNIPDLSRMRACKHLLGSRNTARMVSIRTCTLRCLSNQTHHPTFARHPHSPVWRHCLVGLVIHAVSVVLSQSEQHPPIVDLIFRMIDC